MKAARLRPREASNRIRLSRTLSRSRHPLLRVCMRARQGVTWTLAVRDTCLALDNRARAHGWLGARPSQTSRLRASRTRRRIGSSRRRSRGRSVCASTSARRFEGLGAGPLRYISDDLCCSRQSSACSCLFGGLCCTVLSFQAHGPAPGVVPDSRMAVHCTSLLSFCQSFLIVCRRFHAHSVWPRLPIRATAHWSFSVSSSSRGLLPHLSFSVASLLSPPALTTTNLPFPSDGPRARRQAAEAWPRPGPGARAGLALPPLAASRRPQAPGPRCQAPRLVGTHRPCGGRSQVPASCLPLGIGRSGDGREHLFDR